MPREGYIAAMRLLGASVGIVTTRRGAEPLGLTVSAICSVSADPPHVLVCINRDAEAHGPLHESQAFAVNLLTLDHVSLADRFAGRSGVEGPERFAVGAWRDGTRGCPILADAAAVLECRLVRWLDVASHTVFIGEVESVHTRPEATTLAYRNGAYGNFATA